MRQEKTCCSVRIENPPWCVQHLVESISFSGFEMPHEILYLSYTELRVNQGQIRFPESITRPNSVTLPKYHSKGTKTCETIEHFVVLFHFLQLISLYNRTDSTHFLQFNTYLSCKLFLLSVLCWHYELSYMYWPHCRDYTSRFLFIECNEGFSDAKHLPLLFYYYPPQLNRQCLTAGNLQELIYKDLSAHH